MTQQDTSPGEPLETTRQVLDDPEHINKVETELLDDVKGSDFPEASVFAIRLAFEEAVLNGLRHGHKDLPGTPVTVSWSVTPDRLVLRVRDQGPGFDVHALPDPTAPDRLELPNGRGVMLIHSYMTRVSYNDRGNQVTMEYDRPAGDD